jgi:hypothetical protein
MGFRHALMIAAVLLAPPCLAAEEGAVEIQQRIKAAFLYKFAGYVEWPPGAFAQPESPIVIGVAGAEGIARELEQTIAGRKMGERSLQVRRLARGEKAADCCHILFIGGSERRAAEELLASVQARHALTVTEAEAGQPRGSVINFLMLDNRVRFDISREAEEHNGLQLRSQLLAVARQVVSR